MAGRYRLISALGNGGMGTVWLAEDDLLARRVAVKEVSPPADMTQHEREMLRERTLREARTAAQLSHPNVVAIYDVVEDDGRPWIVMELVPSRSLREVVEENGPLTPQQAAAVGLQVLAALRAAHALGIMHRDVKPGNVLIDAGGRAVLADFGIARERDSPALTTSGVLVGSPSYIGPERARGEQGGPESDLWSLGATLYAIVEGRPPYDRGGALPTLMAVVNEDPDPPSRAGPLWPVIRALLDHAPSRRLSSGAAERMLRQITGTGGEQGSMTLPESPPAGVAGLGWARPGSSLESAERTRTLRPWDGEPDADALLAGPDAAVADQSGPDVLPKEPDPDVLPGEPDPGVLPTEPDPDPLPGEPDRHALPNEPEPSDLPTAPDPEAPARGPDPGAPPHDAEAAVAPGVGAAGAPASSTPVDQAPQTEPNELASEPEATAGGLIPGFPGRPGYEPHIRETGPPARRKRLTWALAAAAALVLVTGAVVAMLATSHHQALATGSPSHSAGHPASWPARPASSHSPTPEPSATSGASTSSPASPAPSPGQGTLGPATIPAGYHYFRNSTGFSIAVPNGWQVSHQGHYVYLLPPSGADFLLIDQSDQPKPNPLADWQQQEANRESTYPGYHRIRLQAVYYAQAEKAADWEFTYYHQDVLTHVLNRNVLANAHHAYALYWSTPESEWGQSWYIFKVLAQTFRPAAP